MLYFTTNCNTIYWHIHLPGLILPNSATMKLLLFHITMLVLIDGGLSIECKSCQEVMQKKPGESDFTEMEIEDDGEGPTPCVDSDVENYKECPASQDTCLKIFYSYAYSDGDAYKTTEYRCEQSENENKRCQDLKTGATGWSWNDFTCETEVIPSKEEAQDGGSQEERCKNEMCSGNEQPQSNFILAVASVVLYGIF